MISKKYTITFINIFFKKREGTEKAYWLFGKTGNILRPRSWRRRCPVPAPLPATLGPLLRAPPCLEAPFSPSTEGPPSTPPRLCLDPRLGHHLLIDASRVPYKFTVQLEEEPRPRPRAKCPGRARPSPGNAPLSSPPLCGCRASVCCTRTSTSSTCGSCGIAALCHTPCQGQPAAHLSPVPTRLPRCADQARYVRLR